MLWKEVGHLGDGFAELGGCFGVIGDSLIVLISEYIYTCVRTLYRKTL